MYLMAFLFTPKTLNSAKPDHKLEKKLHHIWVNKAKCGKLAIALED